MESPFPTQSRGMCCEPSGIENMEILGQIELIKLPTDHKYHGGQRPC